MIIFLIITYNKNFSLVNFFLLFIIKNITYIFSNNQFLLIIYIFILKHNKICTGAKHIAVRNSLIS